MPQPCLPAADPGLPTTQPHTLPRLTAMKHHFVAHAVSDSSGAPIVHAGDYAVADTTDTVPVPGGLFLVEWSNGRRNLMKTRPAACERRVENGHSCLTLRRDGSDTVWFFDPPYAPHSREEIQEWFRQGRMMGTSDGPYDLEYMRTKIVGRIVGVVDGESSTDWAKRQISERDHTTDRQARKIAESLDADMLIDLRDRAGQVGALVVYPGKTAILYANVDCDGGIARGIYKDFGAVFRAERDGLKYSRAKIEAALRKAGRVITIADGEWRPDPAMPSSVLAAHFPPVA